MESEQGSIVILYEGEYIAQLLRQWLQDAGYRVAMAVSGGNFTQDAFQVDFDLVVIEVRLIGVKDVLRVGKLRSLHPDLPIVLYTTLPSPSLAGYLYMAGIRQIWNKWASKSEILESVEDLIFPQG